MVLQLVGTCKNVYIFFMKKKVIIKRYFIILYEYNEQNNGHWRMLRDLANSN